MKPIDNPSDIDLTKHGVIEASAGTGKTYTLENLVVRILVEERVPIEKILLVTFTEKATGEMGQRIRANLEKAIRDGTRSDEEKEILQHALDRFDEASIQTIHGFCQKMLRLYALENGIPFETEVVDDRPLYESCLYDLLRKGWPEKYRDGFESLLRMSGFEGSLSDRKNWRDQIQQIAMKWQPEVGDRLIPEPPEDLGDFVKNFQSVFESQVTTLRECVGTVDESDLEQHPIHVGFSKLKVHGSTKKSILTKMLPPLFRFVAKSKQGQVSWSDFMDLAEESRGYTKFKDTQSFEVLLPIPGDAIESACPGLPRAVAALESLRKLAPGKRVFAGFIRDLREEVDRTKSDRGQISFNDMILHLYSALQPENPASERFLTELRNRFRYGLVDEFQDTDAAQWGIFRRIFLESKKGNRLFLIGDPKQSIYRFRGADVQTYLEAKEEILNSPEGAGYTLDTNWRSTPELIEGFNRLFSKDNGWFRPESKIEHRDCAAPPEDLRKSFLLEDPTGTRAINLIQMTEGIGLRNAKYRIYHWIAGEIRRLMENRERFRIQSGDKERGLRCDDICVLVRARSEAEAFQEILGEDIPSTFYKKAGLYESREAAHLSVLLHALLEPDSRHLRKALLTDFFRVAPETIGEMTRADAPIPYHSMFDRWREWAVDRNWPALFHSILSETQVLYETDDTGELHPTSERSWTNYSHLAQNLETEANVHQWDLSDLVFTLDRYRHRTIEIDTDTDLHRLESESPKVQIMTLHVSKGLQFPVVFIAGGVTEGNRSEPYYKFHQPQTGQVVYDLTKEAANRNLEAEEEKDETSRLFYVGLTRAQYKLYFPLFGGVAGGGTKGALVGQLNDPIKTAASNTELFSVRPDEPFGGEGKLETGEAGGDSIALPDPLFPPERLDFTSRKLDSFSFTGLAHAAESRETTRSYGERFGRRDEETETVEETEVVLRDPILPKGERTGSMIHEVFEKVNYGEVLEAASPDELLRANGPALALVKEHLNRFRIVPQSDEERYGACVKESLRWVWNALQLRLPIGGGFQLGSLSKEDRQHESEFFYPIPEAGELGFSDRELSALEISNSKEGILNGFIDLMFRHEGRYYLLDWKTNFLGDYSTDSVTHSMNEHRYTLQYRIYSIALHRLLAASLPDYDPQLHFGGVVYLYVRGIDPNRPEQGVYWRPASEIESAEEIEKDLFYRVHGVEREAAR